MKGENHKNERAYMSTTTAVINKAVANGYVECFRADRQGLYAPSLKTYYESNEIAVVNFYRFEGESDPGDNSILYIIETMDGAKGTLLDAYGAENSGVVTQFMASVSSITKK